MLAYHFSHVLSLCPVLESCINLNSKGHNLTIAKNNL